MLVPIRDATVTMLLAGAGSGASASMGTISGIIRTVDPVSAFAKVAGAFSDGQLCPGSPTLDGALAAFRAASDIMSDGSNGDPSKECDAISVGIGFDAISVQLGGVVADPPPAVDPCN